MSASQADFDLFKVWSYNVFDFQEYPSMLVIASLADSRVPFWVPLKYTAKLRHMMKSSKHSNYALYLWVQEEGGHFGQGGETSLHEQVSYMLV